MQRRERGLQRRFRGTKQQDEEEKEDDLGIWGPESEVCSGAHALKEDLGVDRRVVNWLLGVWPVA